MRGGCTISFIGLVPKAIQQTSRGFQRRRRTDVDAARVPPGQHVVNGPRPHPRWGPGAMSRGHDKKTAWSFTAKKRRVAGLGVRVYPRVRGSDEASICWDAMAANRGH